MYRRDDYAAAVAHPRADWDLKDRKQQEDANKPALVQKEQGAVVQDTRMFGADHTIFSKTFASFRYYKMMQICPGSLRNTIVQGHTLTINNDSVHNTFSAHRTTSISPSQNTAAIPIGHQPSLLKGCDITLETIASQEHAVSRISAHDGTGSDIDCPVWWYKYLA